MSEETVKSRLSKLREIDGKADKTTDVLTKASDELENGADVIVMDDVPETSSDLKPMPSVSKSSIAKATSQGTDILTQAKKPDVKTDVLSKTDKKKSVAKPETYPAAIQWMLDHKGIIFGIAIFLIYVLIQMKYIYEIWFDPDELDIYTCAYEMFKGKILYKDIPSQHMPWTYIISWIFYVLGARTVFLQRLYFYIMFAGFWTSFIYIYKKHVNKWALVLQPFIYLAIIQQLDFATQILSEHLVVIGAQIFLLEFIVFLKERDISLGACIRMSIAVVLTFGTAFLNIYPLFFLGLGVLVLEIKWGVEAHEKMSDWWKKMGIRYGKLLGIVAIPWLIMTICMLATHSFHDFGFGAYTVNRLYYPKYMSGLGDSIFSTFAIPVTEVHKNLIDINLSEIGVIYVLKMMLIISGIYFAYKIFRTNGLIAGLTVYFYAFAYGHRGYFNFHGTSFLGLAALITALVLVHYGIDTWEKFDKKPVLTKAFVWIMLADIVLAFSVQIMLIPNWIFVKGETNFYQTDSDIVKAITDEDERIWQTNICDSVSWATGRVTTGPTVSVPWMWEAIGSHKIEDYKKSPARVALFYLGYESWGNNMADYAPEAYYFIVNNYKFIPGSTQVWVLNEYYEEACAKLGIDPNTENDSGYSCTPFTVDESEKPGHTYEDRKKELEEAAKAAEAAEAAEEETTEEVTTEEETTEVTTEEETTEATTEDDHLSGPLIDESSSPLDDENTTGPGGTSVTGDTSTSGPSSSGTGNGPGDVTVSPADERTNSNAVTSDTPGAIQAPDGSWVVPDDSTGPGQ